MTVYIHRLDGTTPGEAFSTTLHTESNNDITSSHAAWNAAVNLWLSTAVLLLYATTTEFTTISTASLDNITGKQVNRAESSLGPVPGTATGSMLPPQCAVVVSTRSAIATRGGRGRMFWPAPAASTLNAGRFDLTARSTLATAAGSALDSLITAGETPVIWSRAKLATTPINAVDVGDVFDTQRRRRDKLIEVRDSVALT